MPSLAFLTIATIATKAPDLSEMQLIPQSEWIDRVAVTGLRNPSEVVERRVMASSLQTGGTISTRDKPG
jgi:hypothetical protein